MSHTRGVPAWGLTLRSPLSWPETSGSKQSVVRNLILLVKSVHAHAYSDISQRQQIDTTWKAGRLPYLPPSVPWLGPRVLVPDGRGHALGDLTLGGFCSSTSGDWTPFPLGWCWSLSRGTNLATSDAGSSSSTSSPASCQGDSGRQTPGKDMTCAHRQTHPSN